MFYFSTFTFSFTVSIWFLKIRYSSIIIPKYFFYFIMFIFCPLIWKFMFFIIIILCALKRTISVFLVLREVLFAFSQWAIFFNLKFYFLVDVFMMSKWCISACFVTWYRSFMDIKKRSGPKIVPCGTPWLLVRVSDTEFLMETYWCHWVRKVLNHLSFEWYSTYTIMFQFWEENFIINGIQCFLQI